MSDRRQHMRAGDVARGRWGRVFDAPRSKIAGMPGQARSQAAEIRQYWRNRSSRSRQPTVALTNRAQHSRVAKNAIEIASRAKISAPTLYRIPWCICDLAMRAAGAQRSHAPRARTRQAAPPKEGARRPQGQESAAPRGRGTPPHGHTQPQQKQGAFLFLLENPLWRKLI